MSESPPFDVAILGGGLAGCLTALAFRRHRPSLRVLLAEAASEVAGNHTWCCFASDLGRPETESDGSGTGGSARAGQRSDVQALVDEVVEHRWTGYHVRFPGFERRFETPYLCVTSKRLRRVIEHEFAAHSEIGGSGGAVAQVGATLLTGQRVVRVETISGGETARGRAGVSESSVAGGIVAAARLLFSGGATARAWKVFDARGSDLARGVRGKVGIARSGYQKFLGREVTLRGWAARVSGMPLVMDGTVPQGDGYRFMYALPLGDERVLLEDTSFSDGPGLNLDERRAAIDVYARAHGLVIESVHREEAGVLPMPWTDEVPAASSDDSDSVCERIGFAGGLFHAGTGYSLPIAAEVAVAVALETDEERGDAVKARAPVAAAAHAHVHAHARGNLTEIRARLHEQNRFFAGLNRLMFVALAPDARRQIFERFYRLPVETIHRFYGARTEWKDRARILLGRPPSGFRWRALLNDSLQQSETKHLAAAEPGETVKEAT